MINTSEELKKIIQLPSNVLLKEFTEARERFRNFLKASGIQVPDIVIDTTPAAKNTGNSVLLDDFSAETILAIDDSVLIVYSTVEKFLKLFTKIQVSKVLDDITVTIEGHDPCTAKDVKEQFEKGSVKKEEQLVVASSDLKLLLPDLGIKPKEEAQPKSKPQKVAVLNESDIKELFAEKEKADAPGEQVLESAPPEPEQKAPEKDKTSSVKQFSPIISQAEYDAVMLGDPAKTPQPAKQAEPEPEQNIEVPAEPQIEVSATSPAPAPAPAPKKDARPSTSDSNMLSQNELDQLLSSHKPVETQRSPEVENKIKAASDVKNLPETKHNISQDELDSILKQSSNTQKQKEETSLSQDELDKLFSAPTTKAEPVKKQETKEEAALSQDELDKLFSAPTTKAEPVKKQETKEEAALSQDELDKLFSAPQPAKAEPVKKQETKEEAALSQDELDKLFSAPQPAKTEPVKKQETKEEAALSQDELDKLFSAPQPAKTASGTEKKATVKIEEPQAEVTPKKQPVHQPEAAPKPHPGPTSLPQRTPAEAGRIVVGTVTQDDVDKILLLKGTEGRSHDKKISAEGSMIISQDELDQLMSSLPEEISGKPVKDAMTEEELNKIIESEKKAAPVKQMGTGISQKELDEIFGQKQAG